MLSTNSQLRESAYQSMHKKWSMAVVAFIIYSVLYAVFMGAGRYPAISLLAIFFIIPHLSWGLKILFLYTYRGHDVDISYLFEGYKRYVRILTTILLVTIYQFLWSLLFIIPGIIKFYSYAMTPYILYDRDDIQNDQAIELSMKMMEGHKLQLFLLHLSFIGWFFLSVLTFGIGFLWSMPYFLSAQAAFYEELKLESGLIDASC